MHFWKFDADDSPRARRLILGGYIAAAAIATWQRGRPGYWHTTLLIFRQSFWHLLAGTNLYAPYPAEQGAAAESLFKYSPTAALLFGPFAVPPYAVALFGWSVLGALLLYGALRRLLPDHRGTIVALLVLPELFVSLQAASSNAAVAALMVVAYVCIERGQAWRAAAATLVATAMKLFPIAAAGFVVFQPRWRRVVLAFAVTALVLLLLPLLVTTPHQLLQQYRWWFEIESSDARDLLYGDSAIRLIRGWIGGDWPIWPVQAIATVLLLLPAVIRRAAWSDPEFRLRCLASLLAYAVLFNHQAERPTHIIGTTGAAIWFVAPTKMSRAPWWRFALVAITLVGLRTPPLLIVWLVMQLELYANPFDTAEDGGWALAGNEGLVARPQLPSV